MGVGAEAAVVKEAEEEEDEEEEEEEDAPDPSTPCIATTARTGGRVTRTVFIVPLR